MLLPSLADRHVCSPVRPEVQTEQSKYMVTYTDKDKHVIKRDGLPPLAFTGKIIGSAISTGERWTEVRIYKTKGGNYVAEVGRYTQWDDDEHPPTINATSCNSAYAVVEWLKEGKDVVGRVSQQAIEAAVQVDSGFIATWVETVE